MKDGICGLPKTGLIGIQSRMYTFITEDNHESKKIKVFFIFVSAL